MYCSPQNQRSPAHQGSRLPPLCTAQRFKQQFVRPAHRRSGTETRKINISDLCNPTVGGAENVLRTPGYYDDHHSQATTTSPLEYRIPVSYQSSNNFIPINRQATSPGVVSFRPHHNPGGSSDPQQWTMPPPDEWQTSRPSSNGEGPSQQQGTASVSSHAGSPSASSTNQSLRALSPLILPLDPPPSTSKSTLPADSSYTLSFRQQPLAARACGLGDRDRRTIDPPPILELRITDMYGAPVQDCDAQFVLSCELLDMNGNHAKGPSQAQDSRSVSAMMGNLVASPFQGKDEHRQPGTFFVLSDLSCRYPGTYMLNFSLLRLDPKDLRNGQMATSITSAPFTAYTAKDFPGMRESTPLLKQLRAQGLSVGIKKGSEARKLKGKMRDIEQHDSDYEVKLEDHHHGDDEHEHIQFEGSRKRQRRA